MKKFVLALAGAMTIASAAFPQQHPNHKKGFNANNVYQFNGLDTVNAFNGNLTVSIPIGPSFSVGGGLSYGLTLHSNANLWEGEAHCHPITEGGPCRVVCPRWDLDCDDQDKVRPNFMYPHRRANAGVGWTLSLGRLYHPEHPALGDRNIWTYESPNGADHPFTLSSGSTLTNDGSYLRMTSLADDPFTTDVNDPVRMIEFPDGAIHYYQPPSETSTDHWGLRRITNGFSQNYLTISYGRVPDGSGTSTEHPDYPNGQRWTLQDSHGRKHFIDFKRFHYDGEMRLLVHKVHLYGSNNPATITFDYSEDQDLSRGEYHTCELHGLSPVDSRLATVPLLAAVTLPDNLKYEFDYRPNESSLENQGMLQYVILPTGGKIDWDYGPYYKPKASPSDNQEYYQLSQGVIARKLWGKPNESGVRPLEGTWTYTPNLPFVPDISCDMYATIPIPPGHCAEFTNTITGPLTGEQAGRTVHYFSVATANVPPWSQFDYGLPFTRRVSDDSTQRWLSTETLGPGNQVLRSTYVRYDNTRQPQQVVSTRTVQHDASGLYMDRDLSDWANFGLYRTVRTSGTFPKTPERVTTTHYLPADGQIASVDRWVTGLYDFVTVKENDLTTRTDFCFDPDTGFLKRKRARKNASTPGSTDLLAVFEPDARGNLRWESYYGGDISATQDRIGSARPAASVGIGSICDTATGPLQYQIEHTRVEPTATVPGSLVSRYTGVDIDIVDVAIDPRTGLVTKSRDTAGVETEFQYDWAGRILSEMPTGRATTSYTYLTPTSDEIIVAKVDPDPNSAEPMPTARYRIDAFGRVVSETTEMPGNVQAIRNYVYDAMGRRTSVSHPGHPNALTLFKHDSLGRLLETTAPDGSKTSYIYAGDVLKTRRSSIRTNQNSSVDTSVDVVEQYDGYGRLLSVTEKSGPTSAANRVGAPVKAEYQYDMMDRLVTVRMRQIATGPLQERLFDYDGRGFLRWESHPESGMTSYMYDARGHVVTRTQGAAQSQFDLDFFYDPAERLKRVEARDPHAETLQTPPFRTMKSFTYGPSNEGADLRKGKLTSATRYNYDPVGLGSNINDYTIVHSYKYADTAGRLTDRQTTIYHNDTVFQNVEMAQSYTSLDLPQTVTYPMCIGCAYAPQDVARKEMTRTYDRGRLTAMSGFLDGVSYWPNGMRNVMQRANGIADTQTVGAMPRPSAIGFGTYRQCVMPTIEEQPGNQTTVPVTLGVTVSGTAPFFYDWYDGNGNPMGTASTITVQPTTTTSYHVSVRNSCGETKSEEAIVSIGPCSLPQTGTIDIVTQPDRSWVLKPHPTAAKVRTFTWRKLPSTNSIGSEETLAVGALTQTTQFGLVVTDSCGDSSETTVTILVGLTAPALSATRVTNSQIRVEWPSVAGATKYRIERRSGAGWTAIELDAQSPYLDNAVEPSRTYAYRVQATGNGQPSYSNVDIATTMLFPGPSPGQAISADVPNGMLDAVNRVRAAAGLPALTWETILSPSDPVVGSGKSIASRQLMACRARMNEALQVLGAASATYTDPDVLLGAVKALHIQEVQQRTQ